MKNTVEVGKTYAVSGRYVKVVKVTDKYVEVRWGYNGAVPSRHCDRFYSHSMTKHFVEIGQTPIGEMVAQDVLNPMELDAAGRPVVIAAVGTIVTVALLEQMDKLGLERLVTAEGRWNLAESRNLI